MVLKKHMKDTHGKEINRGIFSNGKKDTGDETDNTETDLEIKSAEEPKWQEPEELLSHIPKDAKNAFDKMLMTGLSRCMFCGKETSDLNDMVAHMMELHGNEIEKMKGNLEFMPSSQDMNELLGSLGKITSMLVGQLGNTKGNEDGENIEKMFTAIIPNEGDLNISEDGDKPDLDGIMEIALEVGMKAAGEMLGDMGNGLEKDDGKAAFWDKTNGEKENHFFTDDEKLVRECSKCGNFKKIGDPICPFCKKESK